MFFEVNGLQQDFLDKEFSQLFFATIDKRGPYLFENNEKYLNLQPQNFLQSFGQNHPLALRAQLEALHLKINLFKLNQITMESLNSFSFKMFQEKQHFSFCHQQYFNKNASFIDSKDSFEEFLETPILEKSVGVEISTNFFLLKSRQLLTTDYQANEENKELLLTTYYFFRLFFEGPYLSPGGVISRISKRNIKLANTIATKYQVSTQARSLEIRPYSAVISTLAKGKILFNNQATKIVFIMPYCLQEEEFRQLEKIFN